MVIEAKAHQELLPAMNGSIMMVFLFGGLRKKDIAPHISKDASGKYHIKDKPGLIAKHGEESYHAIFLRKDDKELNTLLSV